MTATTRQRPARPMAMPEARGPVSAALSTWLRSGSLERPASMLHDVRRAVAGSESLLDDDDIQLALFVLYA